MLRVRETRGGILQRRRGLLQALQQIAVLLVLGFQNRYRVGQRFARIGFVHVFEFSQCILILLDDRLHRVDQTVDACFGARDLCLKLRDLFIGGNSRLRQLRVRACQNAVDADGKRADRLSDLCQRIDTLR